jgi:hypothetical protein
MAFTFLVEPAANPRQARPLDLPDALPTDGEDSRYLAEGASIATEAENAPLFPREGMEDGLHLFPSLREQRDVLVGLVIHFGDVAGTSLAAGDVG